jgi:hypothetical protein
MIKIVSDDGVTRVVDHVDDTTGEVTCRSIEQIPTAEQVNESTLRTRLRTLVEATRTYLAIATPTAAQQAAQVRRSARITLILARLALQDLADITDTDGI